MSSYYTLYNKRLDKKLTHPKVGLWFTPDLDEAKEMLSACHKYLGAINAKKMNDDFIIIDVKTDKEVSV